MHPSQLPVDVFVRQCEFTRTRRSGPGGQHRNKVETAVVATHRPTAVRAEASERRSQAANRDQAILRLRTRLAVEVRRPPPSEPSELWQRRARNARLSIRGDHDDFPALLAECLDFLAAAQFDLAPVAIALEVSASQLVKLLKKSSRAMEIVNRERTARGRRPLR